jgi:hypothetical protein
MEWAAFAGGQFTGEKWALLDCGRLDFNQQIRPCKPRDAEERAGIAGARSYDPLHEHVAVCKKTIQVCRVKVQTDDIRKRESRSGEYLLKIVNRSDELSPKITGVKSLAIGINGYLPRAIKDALSASHFVPLHKS